MSGVDLDLDPWKMRCYRSGNAYLLKYDKAFSIQFRGIYAVYGPEFVRDRAMRQKLVFSRFSHISAAACSGNLVQYQLNLVRNIIEHYSTRFRIIVFKIPYRAGTCTR